MLWIVGFLTLYMLGLFLIAWVSLHPPRIPLYISPGSFDAPLLWVTDSTRKTHRPHHASQEIRGLIPEPRRLRRQKKADRPALHDV